MNVTLSRYDRYVVQRKNEYLMGADGRGNLRWSTSPYDAWWKKDRQTVKRVAGRFGAHVRKFNPITGEVA